MSALSPSEKLFEQFCAANGIPCSRVVAGADRSPDFIILLNGTKVTCEVKQINPNDDDLRELAELRQEGSAGRYLPNRLRGRLKKDVSPQLKSASLAGCATLLVVYDNTPFKSYTDHGDVVQAMFGRNTVTVLLPEDRSLPPQVSAPFFGKDRGMGPGRNSAVSAVAILDGGPHPPHSLRVYHNPYGAVRLDPLVFASLPVTQPVLPDTTTVEL